MNYLSLTLAFTITMVLSTTALEFAFKKGIPTKIVCESSDNGTLYATLSDGTDHSEKVCMYKSFVDEAGGAYDYWGWFYNQVSKKTIEIHDRMQARDLYQTLRWHAQQQAAQTKTQRAQQEPAKKVWQPFAGLIELTREKGQSSGNNKNVS